MCLLMHLVSQKECINLSLFSETYNNVYKFYMLLNFTGIMWGFVKNFSLFLLLNSQRETACFWKVIDNTANLLGVNVA